MKNSFEKVSQEEWEKSTLEFSSGKYAHIGWDILKYGELILPHRKTGYSAGYDIFSTCNFRLDAGEDISIPLGFKVKIEDNMFLMIVPRSGLGFNFYTRLANTVGIIDSDYYGNEKNEGHCFMKIRNEGKRALQIERGAGLAQGIFQRFYLVDGDFLGNGYTRMGGFGHTDDKGEL